MSNSAEIVQFPGVNAARQKTPEKVSKGPQVEDGYTRTANAIVEALMRAPLTSREARIVRAVERATYGWNRPSAWLAASVLSEMTGMPAGKCSETLNVLIRKKVLVRQGSSRSPVRINKQLDEWDFSAHEARVTPKRNPNPKWGESPQDGVTESPQDGVTNKDRKDMTDTDVSERIGEPTRNDSDADKSSPKKPSLPDCPHMEIIDLWAEAMPDKPQPAKNLWQGTARASHLANRWKAGFTIKHERTGEPLYTDRESGIAWWSRFFNFLRKSDFLMGDHRWFKLEWVAKRENFVKILELSYHGGDA